MRRTTGRRAGQINMDKSLHDEEAVLLGRDILKNGALLFDGENEAFSLWF